jgi:transposase-like protein
VAFFKSLKERGLCGVKLVISDSHTGLKAAVRKAQKVASVPSSLDSIDCHRRRH